MERLGLQLALNVAAMLIAFYAVIMLINEMLAFFGGIALFGEANLNHWIQESSGERFDALSLQALFGFLFCSDCLADRGEFP